MTEVCSLVHRVMASPIGPLTAVAQGERLVALWFDAAGSRADLRPAPADLGLPEDDGTPRPLLDAAERQLQEYFAGARTCFDLPLAPVGDDFDQRVWALLRAIPYGTTTTYGQLAERVGGGGFAQAVGRANGRNPLPIIVPCHRVVGSDGNLTGFAGGLQRKRWLLAHEEPDADTAGRLF